MDPISNVRRLRRQETFAEARLWVILRNRRLGGFKFRRQVPIDRYFADFVCREAGLIVELDGASHKDTADYDAQRTDVLESCGFHVLRFDNERVITDPGGVAGEILTVIQGARV